MLFLRAREGRRSRPRSGAGGFSCPVLALALVLVAPAAPPALAREEALRPFPAAAAALRLAQQGQRLVPLEVVIERLRQRYSGDKLDARILERPGAVLYEIKWLTAEGRKLVIVVDAESGNVVATEGAR